MIPQRVKDQRRQPWAVYKPSYRTLCTPDAEWQRCKLESLRYRFGGYQNATRVMQVLGDWGRKYFWWLVRVRFRY